METSSHKKIRYSRGGPNLLQGETQQGRAAKRQRQQRTDNVKEKREVSTRIAPQRDIRAMLRNVAETPGLGAERSIKVINRKMKVLAMLVHPNGEIVFQL